MQLENEPKPRLYLGKPKTYQRALPRRSRRRYCRSHSSHNRDLIDPARLRDGRNHCAVFDEGEAEENQMGARAWRGTFGLIRSQ
jgi:hypothetical protein